MILHYHRILEHPFQVTDPALIPVLLLLCRMVLKILAQISVRTSLLHSLDQFFPLHQLPVVDLSLYLLNITFCQSFTHHFCPFCFDSLFYSFSQYTAR